MFKCDICGKEFETKLALGGHMSGHSRNGKKYPRDKSWRANIEFPKCRWCGRTLKNTRGKYCNQVCQMSFQNHEWIEKWLDGEIDGFSESDHWGQIPDRIRTYLFDKYDSKCCECGWSEVNPFTGKIPLEVEHIDGNYKNNLPENLKLLCPNCHSLTATYRGANRGRGRKKTWKLKDEDV